MDDSAIEEQREPIVVINCETWRDLMDVIEKNFRSSKSTLFRGQRDSTWRVESTLVREVKNKIAFRHPEISVEETIRLAQSSIMRNGGNLFQSYSKHLSKSVEFLPSEISTWIFGRHQGLLSPFVDWSRSPYVSIFFAFAEVAENFLTNKGGSVAIFAISAWMFPSKLGNRGSDNGKLSHNALSVSATEFKNPRGVAQNAVLTYITPDVDIETFVLESHKLHASQDPLIKIVVPHKLCYEVLDHLHLMNINYASLFPDDFGRAMQANLNLYTNVEGMGSWSVPPGFSDLICQNP